MGPTSKETNVKGRWQSHERNDRLCSFSLHPCCLPGMKVTEIALGEKNEGRGKPALGQILTIWKTEAGRDFVPI